jgi:hypothetical protein
LSRIYTWFFFFSFFSHSLVLFTYCPSLLQVSPVESRGFLVLSFESF